MLIKNLDNIIPTVNYVEDRKDYSNWYSSINNMDFHELVYVYKGEVTFIIDNKVIIGKEGRVIYIPRGSTREFYPCKNSLVQGYVCNFSCHEEGNYNINLPFPSLIEVGKNNELDDLFREFNFVWEEKNYCFKLKSRALFMEIIHKCLIILRYLNEDSNYDFRINVIKEFLANNYSDYIDVRKLADMVNLNPTYLGALFKKNTGQSIKEYIRKIRVLSAEKLILSGDYTITEVAEKCGFNDVYYFSRLYKMYKGYPPSTLLKNENLNI